ncbi:MAG: ArsA family ATPase [Candidatus Dormibacteraeota bacterium]|nr:ArsA family ATPase [Candidatus Dormibacteraeota bacterium]
MPLPAGTIEALLQRRVVFVVGKGGTGRTTVAAAIALLAGRAGKRVLAVDVEATGHLAAALGQRFAEFRPRVLQPNVSGIELRAEESFQEYLGLYFKVPRLARLTPLSRVFDFIATGVPGPRDMLVVGKIAYEERRRDQGRPAWDLIVVDSAASGHSVSHLGAAKAMLTLVRGGVIRNQVQWIDDLVRDPQRSTCVVTALPEEMPVVEAVELRQRLRSEVGVDVGAAVLNRVMLMNTTPAQRSLVTALLDEQHAEAVRSRLGGNPQPFDDALELCRRLHERSEQHERQLRHAFREPVLQVPLMTTKPGLATTRAVAAALSGRAA